MQAALEAYLSALQGGLSHREAVVRAAKAVRDRPREVVEHAGLLARCQPVVAQVATGLTSSLRRVPMGSRAAIVTVASGSRFPMLVQKRRYGRGVHDAPVDLATRLVEQALLASDGNVRSAMDTACGPGAFLVALAEAGVPEIFGTDVDPLCLEVAAIACPTAHLVRSDPTRHGPEADLVVGAPPFLSRQQLDGPRRFDFRHRFPWLEGTLDYVAAFAATATGRCRDGGGIGLILPTESLVCRHGSAWRRRVVARHQVLELVGPIPFPGTSVDATMLVAQAGKGPGLLPAFGLSAEEALAADNVVLDPLLRPGDVGLMKRIATVTIPLGEVANVATGIGLSEPGVRVPADLLSDEPGDGRVPFAEARGYFAGERAWLHYKPGRLHRPTSAALHDAAKVVVRRARARSPIHAAVDRDAVYVGSSCTVVAPTHPRLSPERVLALLQSPIVDGWLRVHHGCVTDLTPRILSAIPVPRAWLEGNYGMVAEAFGLSREEVDGLSARAVR